MSRRDGLKPAREKRQPTARTPRRARPADPAATWAATTAFCAGLDEVLGRPTQTGSDAPQRPHPSRDTRNGREAAHGPAGRHDGHSTDDTEEQTHMDIHEFQETGEQARRRLGIDGTAADAHDIRHPFIPTPGESYCLACGLAEVPDRAPHGPTERTETP